MLAVAFTITINLLSTYEMKEEFKRVN